MRESTKKLCDLIGILKDIKNERQLLNLVYLAQKTGAIEKIYDFKFTDLGPFSPELDLDLVLLENEDLVYIEKDEKYT